MIRESTPFEARPAVDPAHPLDPITARGGLPGDGDWDDDPDVLLLEYLEYGPLREWIARANRIGDSKRFSEETCWRIFNDLILACVAMKYPARYQVGQTRVDQGNLAPISGGSLCETIPPARKRVDRNIVHMDIDPSNVFIGGFDDLNDHDRLPFHKVRPGRPSSAGYCSPDADDSFFRLCSSPTLEWHWTLLP